MNEKNGPGNYVTRVCDNPALIDAAAWDGLLQQQSHPTPFMRHAYLLALHESGSAVPTTGWQPQYLAIARDGQLQAACPLYLKSHSYGEYVFDWSWADAYQRHGLHYYPKLLCAVPFTPVPGSRLLACNDEARQALLVAMRSVCEQAGHSSSHVLFLSDADQAAAHHEGWLMRSTVQFHWHNRAERPYADFADFTACLQRDKRKKIAQERRRVREAGVTFQTLQGAEIGVEEWDFFYGCYAQTYREHRSTPYLTRAFFAQVARTLPAHWLMFVACKDGRRIASSLIAIDPERGQAYGRYWGSIEHVDCLHFEACYYQPLEWCIAQRYQRFEGGAQGEHKMARGLLPVETHSAHWLAHPEFSQAVAHYLAQEGQGMAAYLGELNERMPFKA
jgi:uncharacterized protein